MARAVILIPGRAAPAASAVAAFCALLFLAGDALPQSDTPPTPAASSPREGATRSAPDAEAARKWLDAAHIDPSKLAGSDLAAVVRDDRKDERSAPLADPTRPPPTPAPAVAPVSATTAPKGNRLTSVIIGPRGRVAVLDGHQVREGTMVGTARVVRIQRDAVVLQTGTTQERISLYPNVVRKARPQPSSAPVRTHRAKHHE